MSSNPRFSVTEMKVGKFLDSDGNRVNVGNFDANGLNVNNWDDGNRNSNIGLASARHSFLYRNTPLWGCFSNSWMP